MNQREEIVGKELQHTVWAEREASGSAGKYLSTPAPKNSPEDWCRILDQYDQEEIRGSKPRYWEDVQIEDKIGPMIKGPLSVRDELAWLMGAGSPFFRAHKLEFESERRHPKALEYVEETGEADVPELVHIFDAFARNIGVERAYDYGHPRDEWSMPPHTSTVILPSRKQGRAKYPDLPPDLLKEVKKARPLDDMIKEGII